jgi:alkanesulfonate monooxygenase SsuD/methylene tetrahydromethanopterin reductase-like flavin-dependent oxidoreductase (luciferase family)
VGARGRRLDEQIDELGRIWAGEDRGYAGAIGPDVARRPPAIYVGGRADAAFDRAARVADGWIGGGAAAATIGESVEKLRARWAAHGRGGAPKTIAIVYFALGPNGRDVADAYLKSYYGFAGDYANAIAAAAATTAAEVSRYVQHFADAGCDELLFFPCDLAGDQVDRLAEVITPSMA